MEKKIILAIDPGNIESAYVLWDGEKMLDKNYLPNKECLSKFEQQRFQNIDCVVIEMVSSYGMPIGQNTIDTCVWIGIFKQFFHNKEVHLRFRQTVKMHHCHALNGVNDGAINNVLKGKYGDDKTQKRPNEVIWNDCVKHNGGREYMNGDIWAAFALATSWTEPPSSIIQNPLERENNKLTKNLL